MMARNDDYGKVSSTIRRYLLGHEPMPTASEFAEANEQARGLDSSTKAVSVFFDLVTANVEVEDHQSFLKQLPAYIKAQEDGREGSAQFSQLQRHLDSCVACAEEYELLYSVLDELKTREKAIEEEVREVLGATVEPVAPIVPEKPVWERLVEGWQLLFGRRLLPQLMALLLAIVSFAGGGLVAGRLASLPRPVSGDVPLIMREPERNSGLLISLETFDTPGSWSSVTDSGRFERIPVGPSEHAGRYSYNFDSTTDPLQFNAPRAIQLEREAVALSVWVNGDGSGHTLAARLRDAEGDLREYSFGPILHVGWARMIVLLADDTLAEHVEVNPDAKSPAYPLLLEAFVLYKSQISSVTSGNLDFMDISALALP